MTPPFYLTTALSRVLKRNTRNPDYDSHFPTATGIEVFVHAGKFLETDTLRELDKLETRLGLKHTV